METLHVLAQPFRREGNLKPYVVSPCDLYAMRQALSKLSMALPSRGVDRRLRLPRASTPYEDGERRLGYCHLKLA